MECFYFSSSHPSQHPFPSAQYQAAGTGTDDVLNEGEMLVWGLNQMDNI